MTLHMMMRCSVLRSPSLMILQRTKMCCGFLEAQDRQVYRVTQTGESTQCLIHWSESSSFGD